MWQFQMRVLFLGKELMDVVDGTTPKPPPLNMTNLAAWIKKDSQAVHLLCQDVEEKILKYIKSYRTLETIQNKLKEVHDQWSHENFHHIRQWFFDITVEEGETIASFLGKIEEVRNEFTNLGNNIFTDDNVMAKVLNKLPACYRTFQSFWDNVINIERTINTMVG